MQIPITFVANNLLLPPINVQAAPGSTIPSTMWKATTVRPIVFCELTSTMLLYPGRVISVIN